MSLANLATISMSLPAMTVFGLEPRVIPSASPRAARHAMELEQKALGRRGTRVTLRHTGASSAMFGGMLETVDAQKEVQACQCP